jgi:hypothetical protein
MNHLVTLGFVLLLAALVVTLDGSLTLRAIDRLAQSEAYTDTQNLMTVTKRPCPVLRRLRQLRSDFGPGLSREADLSRVLVRTNFRYSHESGHSQV